MLDKNQLIALRKGDSIPPPSTRRKRDNRESRLQKSVIRWWDGICEQYGLHPWLLHSIPNGAVYGVGHTRIIRAMILKDEGLRNGYPDLGLEVARGRFHGLRIEMKLPETHPDVGQQIYHELLRAQGYRVEVCRSLEEAIKVIEDYLA